MKMQTDLSLMVTCGVNIWKYEMHHFQLKTQYAIVLKYRNIIVDWFYYHSFTFFTCTCNVYYLSVF